MRHSRHLRHRRYVRHQRHGSGLTTPALLSLMAVSGTATVTGGVNCAITVVGGMKTVVVLPSPSGAELPELTVVSATPTKVTAVVAADGFTINLTPVEAQAGPVDVTVTGGGETLVLKVTVS